MTCYVCGKEDSKLLSCHIKNKKICHSCCIELQINSEPNFKKCLSCVGLVKEEPLFVDSSTISVDNTSVTTYSYRGGFVHSKHPSHIPFKAIELINRKGAYTARDYLELGEMYLQVDKIKEAISAFLESLTLKEDGYTYLQLAKVYHLNPDFDSAIDCYYNSIRMINNSELLYGKLIDEKKLEEMAKDRNPKKDKNQKVDLVNENTNTDEKRIREKLKKELQKLESEAYRDLGIIYRLHDKPEQAILYLKRAKKLNSACNLTLLELAFTNYLLEKYEKVIEHTEWLIKKNSFVIKNVKISCYHSLLNEYKGLEEGPQSSEKAFSELMSEDYKGYYDIILSLALSLHALTNLKSSEEMETTNEAKINEAYESLNIASVICPNYKQIIFAKKDQNEVLEDSAIELIIRDLNFLKKREYTFRRSLVRT
ncbi:tetratricopeptide repeat protein [Natranaerofaba carboxydovora]|uniref:tetratricopeptide repeat protein n=1 Tax=Natranaerofaba carboxydovora TaxID=2742683 RepID=UPI001F131961|nr:hypothetical protein [Natranaerofaba carboxydovora]UMZ74355.1 Tetratricopeptide repeat protein [Natranaerofaba carboxydovora]